MMCYPQERKKGFFGGGSHQLGEANVLHSPNANIKAKTPQGFSNLK